MYHLLYGNFITLTMMSTVSRNEMLSLELPQTTEFKFLNLCLTIRKIFILQVQDHLQKEKNSLCSQDYGRIVVFFSSSFFRVLLNDIACSGSGDLTRDPMTKYLSVGILQIGFCFIKPIPIFVITIFCQLFRHGTKRPKYKITLNGEIVRPSSL